MTLFPANTGATFSTCRRYRYLLWRRWGDGPGMLWIMLNPSTADETQNDPTVERCQRRAVEMGFAAVYIANIFAWRSTDPESLRAISDPVGPENNETLRISAFLAGMVVCGWGNHGLLLGRGQRVMQMIRDVGVEPYALKLTTHGQPWHPLYVSYKTRPTPIEVMENARAK